MTHYWWCHFGVKASTHTGPRVRTQAHHTNYTQRPSFSGARHAGKARSTAKNLRLPQRQVGRNLPIKKSARGIDLRIIPFFSLMHRENSMKSPSEGRAAVGPNVRHKYIHVVHRILGVTMPRLTVTTPDLRSRHRAGNVHTLHRWAVYSGLYAQTHIRTYKCIQNDTIRGCIENAIPGVTFRLLLMTHD